MLVKILLYFLILLNSTSVEKPNLKTLVYKKMSKKKHPNEITMKTSAYEEGFY